MTDYTIMYTSMRRRYAEAFMLEHPNTDAVLWMTGSGEWQVRVYS